MKIISCIENNNGMMFNNRRVSKDQAVINDIRSLLKENKLHCGLYSKKMFDEYGLTVECEPDFINKSNDNDYFFIEDEIISKHKDKISEVILYKWNRDYPSDFKFDLDLSKFSLEESTEFVGKSHEKILKEVYKRRS